MHRRSFPFPLLPLCLVLFAAAVPAQQPEADSVRYRLAPVLVTGTTATERETPVTFTDVSRGFLAQRYSMQDVPVILAEQPSMISFSDGGNGVGYNFIFLRGFDQRRLSIMVNGVPQNDPEDHNVYWIDFPDLLASASSVQTPTTPSPLASASPCVTPQAMRRPVNEPGPMP